MLLSVFRAILLEPGSSTNYVIGTNTYDRYEMRIHKRVIDLECSETTFGQLTSINIPSGMIIEATELDEE